MASNSMVNRLGKGACSIIRQREEMLDIKSVLLLPELLAWCTLIDGMHSLLPSILSLLSENLQTSPFVVTSLSLKYRMPHSIIKHTDMPLKPALHINTAILKQPPNISKTTNIIAIPTRRNILSSLAPTTGTPQAGLIKLHLDMEVNQLEAILET